MEVGLSDPFAAETFKPFRDQAGAFPIVAYHFVRDGLAHTVETLNGGELDESGRNRHINGKQLCLGLRDYALRRYGRLARTVLRHWHIDSTADFGKIVYAMVDAKLIRKDREDSFDDFVAVFDFEEAFSDCEPSHD